MVAKKKKKSAKKTAPTRDGAAALVEGVEGQVTPRARARGSEGSGKGGTGGDAAAEETPRPLTALPPPKFRVQVTLRYKQDVFPSMTMYADLNDIGDTASLISMDVLN